MADRDVKRLSELIAHMGNGRLDQVGGELIGDTINAVATYPGTKGRLVVTIDVEDKGEGIFLDASFRTKKPYEPIPRTRVWVDNGQLSLFDPDPNVVVFPGPRGGGGGRGRGPAS